MKFTSRHTTKKSVACLILWLMGLLIINKTVFLHSHILANGTVVTHAHPYQKAGDSQHNHTKAAFFFYDNIELLFNSSPIYSSLFILNHSITFRTSGIPDYSPEYASNFRNRAPPLLY